MLWYRWKYNAVAFVEDVFLNKEGSGPIDLWSRQKEMLMAVSQHDKVCIRSGHKVAKTFTLALMAWWRFVCYPNAQVIFTNSSETQVELQDWKEICGAIEKARFPLVGSKIPKSPDTGIRHGQRMIIGFTTNNTERFAGYSGPDNMYVLDEASGIKDGIYNACRGNRTGGGKIVAAGNPTQNSGWFYDAHMIPELGWKALKVSSEEVATEIEAGRFRDDVGLACWKSIREDHPDPTTDEYKRRVTGEFVEDCVVRLFPEELLQSAIDPTIGEELPSGGVPDIIWCGLDVGRFGDDPSAWAECVNWKVSNPILWYKCSITQTARNAIDRIKNAQKRFPSATINLSIDQSNNGAGVIDAARDATEADQRSCVIARRFGDRIHTTVSHKSLANEPLNMRAAMYSYFKKWLMKGGKIPNNPKLLEELRTVQYKDEEEGRFSLTPKEDMKKRLKRSPDRSDAVVMAVYNSEGELRLSIDRGD